MRLLLHREASSVLADAFELYANAYERSILLKDFYGKEASLFSVTVGSDEEKERSKKGLKGILEGTDKERRKRVMNAVKENLTTMYVHEHGVIILLLTLFLALASTTPIRVQFLTQSFTASCGSIWRQ